MRWLGGSSQHDDVGGNADRNPIALVTAEPADIDEELPEAAPRTGLTNQRRALAGGAGVLIAAAVIARAVTGHDNGKPAAAGSPSRSVPPSATESGPTPILLPAPAGKVLTGPVRPLPPQFRPAGCPADADNCATTYGLPDQAMEALRRAFPGSVLSEAVSLLAQRPGRFGPDLVSRAFRARIASTEVTVFISKPTTAQTASVSDRHYGHISTTTSLRQAVPGFVVSIDVSQPARNLPVALDYLVQLANDDGLVVPQ
jgi:hypothetical protein